MNREKIHGIVLLDKPTGVTSNRVLQQLKHHFNAAKAGHTGSLDPLATGLLPICFGQATKVSEYLLHSDKKYTTTIKLGVTTDTLDSEGDVTEQREVDVSDQSLQQALEKFRGDIDQVPPMFSALKRDGQPLYKLARQGVEVERKARSMTVHSLVAKRLAEDLVELDVHCSSGFYIRSLADDLGQELGCGAHVVKLRRTAIKDVLVSQAHSLDELLATSKIDDVLLPIDSLLGHLPKLTLAEAQTRQLLQGQKITDPSLEVMQLARIYSSSGALFAVGEVSEQGMVTTKKIFVTE